MSHQVKLPVSTHILDTSLGRPAANVPVSLHKLINNQWSCISQSSTDLDGRCQEFVTNDVFTAAIYKLRFDISNYFQSGGRKSFYPFVEVVFECETGEHYHVPLLLNPFGYSTYRGS